MTTTRTQVMTVRVPTVVVEAAQQEAERQHMTVSEFVRMALLTVLELNPAAERHTVLLYEIVKTRSLLLRYLEETHDSTQIDQLIESAEVVAAEYVHERLGSTP